MKNDCKNILAIDPGRQKCGFAVIDVCGKVVFKKIVATECLCQEIEMAKSSFEISVVVIGNGTTGKEAGQKIKEAFHNLTVEFVDEYRTTDKARIFYWEENPPKSWRRLIPTTMQTPPVPVDDYAAVLLGRKYLEDISNEV